MSDMAGGSVKTTRRPNWSAALRALKRDPALARVIAAHGPCTLEPVVREPYEALVRAIAHQQVHGRAAEAILGRCIAHFPQHPFPPPEGILALPVETMRGFGFSGSKVAAIRDIAEKTVGGLVPTLAGCAHYDDAALIERLVAIRGVGRWTVEMLLIFTLGRPDILPVDDFGVREGWKAAAGLETQPKPKALAEIGEAWAPWRSVAAWYLWRAADAAKLAAKPAPKPTAKAATKIPKATAKPASKTAQAGPKRMAKPPAAAAKRPNKPQPAAKPRAKTAVEPAATPKPAPKSKPVR